MTVTALITGAGGFLGRRLIDLGRQRGWDMRGTVRDRRTVPADAFDVAELDLSALESDWRRVLRGVDIVIHAAARTHVLRETEVNAAAVYRSINIEATERIARVAAEKGAKRFVFVSSIHVHGGISRGGPFTEESAQEPATLYAKSKRDAEAALQTVAQKTGLEVVIVRPPLVYGPNVKANFLRLIELVDKGVTNPFALVKNRRSLIYVDNLTDMLLTAAIHPDAAGRFFVAADDTVLSTQELWREIAIRLGRPCRTLSVPASLLRAVAWAAGKADLYEKLCGSLEVDASQAKRTLDWRPPVGTRDALDVTMAWYRSEHSR